jgi:hypothetical protein
MNLKNFFSRRPRIQYGATMQLPIDDAFAFLSDPDHWPLFFSNIESVDKAADWGSVGGGARMTSAFLGRSVTSDLELTVWDPPQEFRYVMRQPGKPSLDNRRTLVGVAGGSQLVGTTEAEPRGGLAGLADRLQLALIHRVYGKAMGKLPRVATDWAAAAGKRKGAQ